jgi:hypothetical protein
LIIAWRRAHREVVRAWKRERVRVRGGERACGVCGAAKARRREARRLRRVRRRGEERRRASHR